MTAKEQRQVRRLEVRIEELERHLKISTKSGSDTFLDLYNTRTALRQAHEALAEAMAIIEQCIKDDPAFIQQRQTQVIADF